MKIQTFYKFRFPIGFRIKYVTAAINSIMKYLERKVAKKQKPRNNICYTSNETPVFISLTSFPARIKTVHMTIMTLLNQSVKVNGIVLWLAESQFPNQVIPEPLVELVEHGLTIRFCDDLRSHKKYYYIMKENPNAIVITVDDDVIYPENTVEKLLKKHRQYPDSVISNTARWIKFNEDGTIQPYIRWKKHLPKNSQVESYLSVPIGVGGVLYPPGCLHADVFCIDKIKELAWLADDLWLKAMALKKGTKSVNTRKYSKTLTSINIENNESLTSKNVGESNNDVCISKLISEYPELLDLLRNNK